MSWLTIVATIALGATAVAVGASARAARRGMAEEIEGARIARRLAWYNYRTNEWRPDSWHPDRTGDNKHPSGRRRP